MKKISEIQFARFIPLSVIILAASAAVALFAGCPGVSPVINGFHLFTLLFSVFCNNIIFFDERAAWQTSVVRIFFFTNVMYVFIAGVVFSLFRSDLTVALFVYFLENFTMLLADAAGVLWTAPGWLYAVLLFMLGAGHLAFYLRAEQVFQKVHLLKRFPPVYITLFAVSFMAVNISSFAGGQSGERGTFRGVDYARNARTKQAAAPGFRERYGYNISPGTDIVIIILEGVSDEYFYSSNSRYLNDPAQAVKAANFFVPTPHTSLSVYSLLTGNYGDYRSRQRVTDYDAANSFPSLMRSRGYKTYFIYSGPTYFEGLHDILKKFDLTVINKEKLEALKDPRNGRPYKTFNWGVDDAALIHASADILSDASGPCLFYIGLSSTHSPYFNPDPENFCRFDNSSAEGRYRNSIEYSISVIDRLIETFTRRGRDALFIIVADHGESFGQEGFSKHSFSLYNTEVRVPFIMIHRSFGGRLSRFNGAIIDVYPSLADMMGLDLPASVDGRSFFSENYSLSLFLSSWRDGSNKGLILGDRKWIYSRKPGTLYEMKIDDSGRIDLTRDPGKNSFVKFLNRQY